MHGRDVFPPRQVDDFTAISTPPRSSMSLPILQSPTIALLLLLLLFQTTTTMCILQSSNNNNNSLVNPNTHVANHCLPNNMPNDDTQVVRPKLHLLSKRNDDKGGHPNGRKRSIEPNNKTKNAKKQSNVIKVHWRRINSTRSCKICCKRQPTRHHRHGTRSSKRKKCY